MRKLVLALPLLAACGAGVPVQLRIDEITVDLSIDEQLASIENALLGTGILPPESTGVPEKWPEQLPDVCYDTLIATDPAEGGQIDLTPDPAVDPAAADRYAPVNDGLVSRIEIDQMVLRVEENTLNFKLPPVEVQAADAKDAQGSDRRAWRTLGTIGGTALSPPCQASGGQAQMEGGVEPGAVVDLPFVWEVSGESFLNNQLADDHCLENQMTAGKPANALACKELAVRARTRLVLDTRVNDKKPHGRVRFRVILVATFFVTP